MRGLIDVGNVSYVPVPVLIGSVSPSRLRRPLDGEQAAHDGSFDWCFAQFGHVGNVPHDRQSTSTLWPSPSCTSPR